jgi:hypothetical protein
MIVYCIEDFKIAYEKLLAKNSYKTLADETINYFFGKSIQDLTSGTRLNHNDVSPYIKKRLGGRGGFRVYFLILIKNDSLYLMFVHPKTGVYGADNITDESKAQLYKRVLDRIEQRDLYRLSVDSNNKYLVFDLI